MSSQAEHAIWQHRIVRNKRVCGGAPVFKGTRVLLQTVLASLAEGDTPEQIMNSFPSLTPEDIRAAIAFAADAARDDVPLLAYSDSH